MINTRSVDEPFMIERNAGYFEYQLPISVKAVVAWNGELPLLRNERNEWELPGGKLELGEDPGKCLYREIEEELGWQSNVGAPYYCWVYEITPSRHVFVLTFATKYEGSQPPAYSHEHKNLVLVRPSEIESLNMPEHYKESIRIAVRNGLFD